MKLVLELERELKRLERGEGKGRQLEMELQDARRRKALVSWLGGTNH